jgi:hypothetical protein
MRRLLVTLLVPLALMGCPAKRLEFGPMGRIEDPEALLRLVKENENKALMLQGDAKVRVDAPDSRGAFTMFVSVSRPGLIHFEPMDFFGRPLAVLVVNGESFGLYHSQENRYYTGPATPANISRFLPVALPTEELTRLMLGVAPTIPYETAELKIDEKCPCYVLTLHKGEITQRLEIEPSLHRVQKSEVRGVRTYDLEMSGFTRKGDVPFPKEIRLKSTAAKVDLQLRYKDFELNQAPDMTLFELSPPEDVPVVQVDAYGQPVSSPPQKDGEQAK